MAGFTFTEMKTKMSFLTFEKEEDKRGIGLQLPEGFWSPELPDGTFGGVVYVGFSDRVRRGVTCFRLETIRSKFEQLGYQMKAPAACVLVQFTQHQA